MTLDEIMEKEEFNDVEKALVNHPTLSQAERIKIISEIRAAKANEKHSFSLSVLTTLLATLGLLSLMAQVLDDSTVFEPQSLVFLKLGFVVAALILWLTIPRLMLFYGSLFPGR